MSYFKSYYYDSNILTVYLDPIMICNQHCWYCLVRPESKKDSKWNRIMPFSKIKQIINALSQSKYIIDIDFVGGEPTLHKDLKKALTLACSMKNFRKVRVLTNGLRDLEPYAVSDKIEFVMSLHPSQTDGIKFVQNAKKLIGKSKFEILVMYDGICNNFDKCIELLQKNDLLKYSHINIVESKREDMPLNVTIPNLPLFDNLKTKEFELNDKHYSMIELKDKKLNSFKGWKCYKSLIKIFVDGTIMVSGSKHKMLNNLEELKNYVKICDTCISDYCEDSNTLYHNLKEKDD